MSKNVRGYIYVPLLLSILVVFAFVLSGGLILSEESPSVDEITEKYTLVEKEASPSSQTLQLSTLEFTSQTLPADPIGQVFCQSSGNYDIALVIDNSDSITNVDEYLKKTKDAMISIVDAFLGKSTQFSITRFSTTAKIIQSFTDDTDKLKFIINSIDKDDSPVNPGYTNWQDALTKARETLDSPSNRPSVPDLVIIATDGEPNKTGENGDQSSVGGAVDAASLVADDIKGNKNAEITALGIGGDLEVGAKEGIENLIKITGSKPGYDKRLMRFRYHSDPGDHIILTDFDTFSVGIANLIGNICGP